MNLSAAAPRVVIAGAGPGGLAAASLLREAGAVVTVIERAVAGRVDPARRASVVIGEVANDVLSRVGGRGILDDAANLLDTGQHMASLSRLDADLGAHAESLGAIVRRGSAVEDVLEGAAAADGAGVTVAVRDARSGVRELIDADWFIDATGGKSLLASDPRFTRELAAGPFNLYGDERRFVAMQAAADPARATGWTGPNGAFAINNRTEGVLHAYRGGEALGGSAPKPTAAEGAELLRDLGIAPESALGAPYSFTGRQTIAAHAADGRVLLVGDSVGTMLPVEQMGTALALTDAERAATTILAAHRAPDAAGVLIARYDAETTGIHRAFIR